MALVGSSEGSRVSSSGVHQLLRELDDALETIAASQAPTSSRLKSDRVEFIRHKMLVNIIDQLGLKEPSFAEDFHRYQAVRMSQRLQITEQSLDSSPHVDIAGSNNHWLGVQPEDIIVQSDSGPQLEGAAVVQAISSNLAEWAARWASVLKSTTTWNASGASANGASIKLDGALSEQLPERVAEQRKALDGQHAAVYRQLKDVITLAMQVLTVYAEMDEAMLSFAETEILQHQKQLDGQNLAYDEAWVTLLQAKLRAIETQLEWQTYTPSHIRALAKVHGIIQEQLGSTQQRMEVVLAKLATYENLGPGFAVICQEYGQTQKQISEVKRMLADFDAVVAELEQQG